MSKDISDSRDTQIPIHVSPAAPAPRPAIGNAAPLGLLSIGMTLIFLTFAVTGWGHGPWLSAVIGYAFFYGGLAQFVAGVFEMAKGSTFTGTVFMSYGAFWAGWALKTWFQLGNLVNDPYNSADQIGETLWAVFWGVLTLIYLVASLRLNAALVILFSLLSVTFFLLAGAQYNADCGKAAGYMGFFTGVTAMYGAAAMIWNEVLGVTMPLMGPIKLI